MLRKILYNRINQLTEKSRRKEKSSPILGNWIIRVIMSSKNSSSKKKLFIFTAILLGILTLIFAALQFTSRPTSDKDRVTNDTDINVMVKTADASRTAIIKSYDADKLSEFSKSKKLKILSSTCGKIEGDVPNVSIKNKDDSYIKISFQDKNSKKKTPNIESIKLYTAAGMPVNPKKRQDIGVLYNYDYKTDELSMYLSEFIPADKLTFSRSGTDSTDDTANEEDDIWFCIFEIKYSIESKKYVTYAAVAVGE